jgi:CheY-like chemotaxis protein
MDDRRVRILIIDDDENVLMSLEHVLEGEGYSTSTAWSGREALRLLGKAEFDLLLIDEHLPDLEVSDLCRSLQDTRPQAQRLLMRPLPGGAEQVPLPGMQASVCKWQPIEVMAAVRSCLVAQGAQPGP